MRSTVTHANGRSGSASAEAADHAIASGLLYVSDREPGIRRRRNGRGFRYLDAGGREIRSARKIARIASLAIPPAYRDVWICADARGHLQATGRDARGRKQYRYHPEWRELRDHVKFDRMVAFGEALPRLRRRLRSDLRAPGHTLEKVLAVVVRLLDTTAARVGNREYARMNGSFGLTTLRDRHARFGRGRVQLTFRGKGGAGHDIVVDDARIARIVRRCQELPGQQLFQYLDDDGVQRPIDSGQINDYLRETMGADFTAKDFRTWAATVRAIALLACTPLPRRASARAVRSCILSVVRRVAEELRNTPAVCRRSYINPAVFVAWESGALHRAIGTAAAATNGSGIERHALAFLRREARAARSRSRGRGNGSRGRSE